MANKDIDSLLKRQKGIECCIVHASIVRQHCGDFVLSITLDFLIFTGNFYRISQRSSIELVQNILRKIEKRKDSKDLHFTKK